MLQVWNSLQDLTLMTKVCAATSVYPMSMMAHYRYLMRQSWKQRQQLRAHKAAAAAVLCRPCSARSWNAMLPWPRWCAQTPPGWRACWAALQPPQLSWPILPRRCLLARRAKNALQMLA